MNSRKVSTVRDNLTDAQHILPLMLPEYIQLFFFLKSFYLSFRLSFIIITLADQYFYTKFNKLPLQKSRHNFNLKIAQRLGISQYTVTTLTKELSS